MEIYENANLVSDDININDQDQFDYSDNLNINQLIDDVNKIQENKPFYIKETKFAIYIENKNQNCSIKLPKPFERKISLIENNDEISNMNFLNVTPAEAILGIFNMNGNKYLAYVDSSENVASIMNNNIYSINSIELINITDKKEFTVDIDLIKVIKELFSSGNFYYSDNYDIAFTFNNNVDNNKDNNKYIFNYPILKSFIDNKIPELFYSYVIFGYIEDKNNISLNETIDIDIVVIERYYTRQIIISKEIPEYKKQIEVICSLKNKKNKYENRTFSYICYNSSESVKNINSFIPCDKIFSQELKSFKNIICIINNLGASENSPKLKSILEKINKNFFDNKISIIDFTSTYHNNKSIDSYISLCKDDTSNNNIQNDIFWFIDLDNENSHDNKYFNAFIKMIWKVIKEQVNLLDLNIDIGEFNNMKKSILYQKFNEIIIQYYNNNFKLKKPFFNGEENMEDYQKILDKYFHYSDTDAPIMNVTNIITNNNNNNSIKEKTNKEESKKINILCITWNIAGITSKNYDIKELFTNNEIYKQKKAPDIIIFAIQEIVKLTFGNIINIFSNQKSVTTWTTNIILTLGDIYPNEVYREMKCLNLVGIYLLIMVKDSLTNDIVLKDHNITKTGIHGTMGNKGFCTVTFQCFDKITSIGSGHFEAGESKNDERIKTLIQLLNKPIKLVENQLITFKDADYWIILGDVNFRIDLSYGEVIKAIKEKKFDSLYKFDQFNTSLEKDEFLQNHVCESKINFEPTYKYEKDSNEYDKKKGRIPSYTDRIFFCKEEGIKMISYKCINNLKYSDHRPVIGVFELEVNKRKSLLSVDK